MCVCVCTNGRTISTGTNEPATQLRSKHASLNTSHTMVSRAPHVAPVTAHQRSCSEHKLPNKQAHHAPRQSHDLDQRSEGFRNKMRPRSESSTSRVEIRFQLERTLNFFEKFAQQSPELDWKELLARSAAGLKSHKSHTRIVKKATPTTLHSREDRATKLDSSRTSGLRKTQNQQQIMAHGRRRHAAHGR